MFSGLWRVGLFFNMALSAAQVPFLGKLQLDHLRNASKSRKVNNIKREY